MSEHTVVIVGAGPTGMMLAAELALAGVEAVIVERRAGPELEGPRALGLHARTIEILDQRGVADRFLTAGSPMQVQSFGGIAVDISDLPARHHYGLALPQRQFEPILAGWLEELGVATLRRREVAAFVQDDSGVNVRLADGETIRAGYLVGCDGGRSLVRKAAGIDFPGWDPSVTSLLAEVRMSEEPALGVHRDDNGQHAVGPAGDGRFRVVVSQPYSGPTDEPDLADLSRALIGVWGTDFGAHDPTWISRFTDMSRQAATYRNGRVFLAGDAAHVHYPVGGQGLNLGVQDAVNLGWKLAQVIRGTSSDDLLDTYQAERHPVAARVLQTTMAATVLLRSTPQTEALKAILTTTLALVQPRHHMGAALSGLGIRYDLGGGHPLVGWRMPDFDLETDGRATRVFDLLNTARPVLIDFGAAADSMLGPWADRVDLVAAHYDGPWELPGPGPVVPARAVLIRPDGYVAWAGDTDERDLAVALETWFGRAAA
ncbi:MAG TPA: FAD-dependent monooxygenase [Acidimicrobiales bacterium]|jgi:3-(3-hydroxy-phenyl)propionate hydroxylase|nr:FAD-dependent monooxygenase [Acidimicrobiales bacterium]